MSKCNKYDNWRKCTIWYTAWLGEHWAGISYNRDDNHSAALSRASKPYNFPKMVKEYIRDKRNEISKD